jgi:hypothetical protein
MARVALFEQIRHMTRFQNFDEADEQTQYHEHARDSAMATKASLFCPFFGRKRPVGRFLGRSGYGRNYTHALCSIAMDVYKCFIVCIDRTEEVRIDLVWS